MRAFAGSNSTSILPPGTRRAAPRHAALWIDRSVWSAARADVKRRLTFRSGRGNAHRQTQDALFVAPGHDLGVFVEPMQPLPVAGVKAESDHRPSANEPVLD